MMLVTLCSVLLTNLLSKAYVARELNPSSPVYMYTYISI